MGRFATLILWIALAACQAQPEAPPAATMAEQTPPFPPAETIAPPVSTTEPALPAAEAAQRVSLADAEKALDSGRAVLVDVRGADSYAAQHARGAIHIPEDQILNRIADLPIGKMVITYCT